MSRLLTVGRGVVYSLCSGVTLVHLLVHYVVGRELSLMTPVYIFLSGVAAIFTVVFGILALSFAKERTCLSHDYISAFWHYLFIQCNNVIGKRVRQQFESDTQKCGQVQEELLRYILRHNADTEYGRKFDFPRFRTTEDFRRMHPLTRYESYKNYIDRAAMGVQNVLTTNKIVRILLTSGTTGSGSMFPASTKYFRHYIILAMTAISEIYRLMPQTKNLQKMLWIKFDSKPRVSEGGLPMGPASGLRPGSVWGLVLNKIMDCVETSPSSILKVTNEPQCMYLHCLFGLKDRTVGIINGMFAQSVYSLFATIETKWPQLVIDIENGYIDPKLEILPQVREEINKQLQPDPERAKELKTEFQKGFRGISRRVWPYLNYIGGINTGSMKPYAKKINEHYAPVTKLNLIPYWLMNYEVGAEYEIVLTNEHGLYRYRFGDVIKVAHYHNNCPAIEFMYRRGQLLDVHSEKTSEVAVYGALQDTLSQWSAGISLVDYTCAESVMLNLSASGMDIQCEPGIPYYVLFLELENQDQGRLELSEYELSMFDQNLRRRAFAYNSFRLKGSIAPARVYLVKSGTFDALQKYLVDNTTATFNQYKVARVLKRKTAIDFMMNNVL
uniref:4-substituted benzoates-glutamate ligase GH3.12-like n=1 Tax=Saccoglossus kowalevskii TaxID=10224 RepID=A0ABM0LXX4_SACKO|nr:PREDICTED: 4-substituted benzoates-glutamate ligase GH3.12-like [Saccoglossus kowalevskii]